MTKYDASFKKTARQRLLEISVFAQRRHGIASDIAKLRRRYAKYETTPQETRQVMDQALGSQSLTAELLNLREQRR